MQEPEPGVCLRIKVAGGRFHPYKLHMWLLVAIEMGDKKGDLWCLYIIPTDRGNSAQKATHWPYSKESQSLGSNLARADMRRSH